MRKDKPLFIFRMIAGFMNKLFRIYFFILEKLSFKNFGRLSVVNIPGATSYQPVDTLNFFELLKKSLRSIKIFAILDAGQGKLYGWQKSYTDLKNIWN